MPEGREVQTCVWPWGTCSLAPHLVPVGPSAAHPGWTPGSCVEHTAGYRLTSGKCVVAMRFLPTPLCYPADHSLCFSQTFPLTRCWSQLKTIIYHSDPPPCHLESSAAAAAAKSLQSCLTLCNPTDGSPPGSAVPGILQARILEWVAISFSKA